MARIRTIKPEWLDDEKLCQASDTARLLSVALIVLADDFGNGRAHEMYVASHVWGYGDNKEALRKASRGLQELSKIGFVRCYTVGQQSYYHITNWDKHQKISHPSKTGIVPAPYDTQEGLGSHSGDAPDDYRTDLDLDPDLDLDRKSKSESKDVRLVFDYWVEKTWWGKGPEPKLDDKRKRYIEARLKDFSVNDLKQAIDGCVKSPWHNGSDPKSNGKKYQAIGLIFRDREKVEQFIQLSIIPSDAQATQIKKPQEVLDAERILRTATQSMLDNGERERCEAIINNYNKRKDQ